MEFFMCLGRTVERSKISVTTQSDRTQFKTLGASRRVRDVQANTEVMRARTCRSLSRRPRMLPDSDRLFPGRERERRPQLRGPASRLQNGVRHRMTEGAEHTVRPVLGTK